MHEAREGIINRLAMTLPHAINLDRFLNVIVSELGRMMTALRSRGCDPRSPRHWPVLARSLGALFIRSYERGERVHLAMLSRGYTGTLPDTTMPHTHAAATASGVH